MPKHHAPMLIAFAVSLCVGTSAHADDRVRLFSDAEPLSYTTAAPNYVAPAAPPPIYVDQQARTYCRRYSHEERIGNRVSENYGKVCLQPDGSWRAAR